MRWIHVALLMMVAVAMVMASVEDIDDDVWDDSVENDLWVVYLTHRKEAMDPSEDAAIEAALEQVRDSPRRPDRLRVGRVDCHVAPDVCFDFGVRAFPSLGVSLRGKYYEAMQVDDVAAMDADAVMAFVTRAHDGPNVVRIGADNAALLKEGTWVVHLHGPVRKDWQEASRLVLSGTVDFARERGASWGDIRFAKILCTPEDPKEEHFAKEDQFNQANKALCEQFDYQYTRMRNVAVVRPNMPVVMRDSDVDDGSVPYFIYRFIDSVLNPTEYPEGLKAPTLHERIRWDPHFKHIDLEVVKDQEDEKRARQKELDNYAEMMAAQRAQ